MLLNNTHNQHGLDLSCMAVQMSGGACDICTDQDEYSFGWI